MKDHRPAAGAQAPDYGDDRPRLGPPFPEHLSGGPLSEGRFYNRLAARKRELSENDFAVAREIVGGYIALTDVTHGANTVRSQTYEPYMPLFAAALIYLVSVSVLSALISRLERRMRVNER